MATATGTAVHLSRLAAELPDGWSVGESALFRSPEGTAVNARVVAVPEGADAATLVAEQLAELAGTVEDLAATDDDTPATLAGLPATGARFRFRRDGELRDACILWAVAGDAAVSAGASWPAGTPGDADVATVAAGLRLLPRPQPLGPPADTSDPGGTASPPSGADDGARAREPRVDWTELRRSWDDGQPGGPPEEAGRWSPDELAVLALVAGAPVFPTVGSELLAALPAAAQAATVAAVTRSLLARGVLAGADGAAVLDPALRDLVETAVRPELVASVDRAGTGAGRWWLGVRGGHGVEVSVGHDGTRSCSTFDPAGLAVRLLELAGCAEGAPSAHGDRVVEAASLSGLAALVTLRTVWREGGVQVGGELTWAEDPDGGWASGDWDAEGTRLTLAPAGAGVLRSDVLAHLPGGVP